MATWKKVITTNDDADYKNSNVSGFLIDSGNDTTTGTITAAGFTTTGTWTFDEFSSGTVGITTVQDSGTSFDDNDTSLLTAGAIADYVASQVNSGDITGVRITATDSIASTSTNVNDNGPGVATFTITNTGGITISGADNTDTITIGVSAQLADIHGMTTDQTEALATISDTSFSHLHGRGSNELQSIGDLNDSDDGIVVNHSSGANAGDIKVTTFSSVKNAMDDLYWNFAHSSGIRVSGGDVDIDNNLNIDGNLTVQGTTTTVNSTTVEIADKMIVLANGSNSAANATGAGIEIDTDNATKQPTLQWSNDSGLSQWAVYYEGNATKFPLAIMSSGTASVSGNGGGVGSFYFETDAKELYVRID